MWQITNKKRWLLVGVLSLALWVAACAGIVLEDPVWHMNSGLLLLQKAEAIFLSGLENREKGKALLREVERELSLAITLFKETERDKKLKGQCYFLLGRISEVAFEDPAKAKTLYQTALQYDPEHPKVTDALTKLTWPIFYISATGVAGVYPDGHRRVETPLPRVQSSLRLQGELAMPIWSPNGTWFAYVTQDPATGNSALKLGNLQGDVKAIFTTGLTTGKEIIAPPPRWSPDGRRIAVILLGDPPMLSVAVIDVAEEKIRARYKLPPATIDPKTDLDKFRWSPDGQNILLSWEAAVVIDTVTGIVETVANQPILAEWAPTSNGVYYFALEGTPPDQGLAGFYLKQLGAAKPIQLMDKEQIKAFGLTGTGKMARRYGFMALSPKGSKLAIWEGTILEGGGPARREVSVVHIYDLRDGRTVALDKPFKSFRTSDLILALEWAPDETRLAAAVLNGTISIKLLDLSTGAWRWLVNVGEGASSGAREAVGMWYTLGYKSLSWTQE